MISLEKKKSLLEALTLEILSYILMSQVIIAKFKVDRSTVQGHRSLPLVCLCSSYLPG